MAEYKGFRADRLREAMKKHGAEIEDIFEVLKEISTKRLFCKKDLMREKKHHLLDVTDGEESPTEREFFAICYACKCSADYLLGLSDEIY